jgi:hypothetical protein
MWWFFGDYKKILSTGVYKIQTELGRQTAQNQPWTAAMFSGISDPKALKRLLWSIINYWKRYRTMLLNDIKT